MLNQAKTKCEIHLPPHLPLFKRQAAAAANPVTTFAKSDPSLQTCPPPTPPPPFYEQ